MVANLPRWLLSRSTGAQTAHCLDEPASDYHDGAKPLVAISLNLLMGWNKSPAFFFTATETVTDLANQVLCTHTLSQPHKLDARAAAVVSNADSTLDLIIFPLSQDPLREILSTVSPSSSDGNNIHIITIIHSKIYISSIYEHYLSGNLNLCIYT